MIPSLVIAFKDLLILILFFFLPSLELKISSLDVIKSSNEGSRNSFLFVEPEGTQKMEGCLNRLSQCIPCLRNASKILESSVMNLRYFLMGLICNLKCNPKTPRNRDRTTAKFKYLFSRAHTAYQHQCTVARGTVSKRFICFRLLMLFSV